jgi:glycerol-3-phosphate acyltransferase PlsY
VIDWLLVPIAYLVGSVQWGIYVVQLTTRVDVRTVGSGKTGTTNVLRAAGKRAAVVVLLADAAKGAAIVMLARVISDDTSLHALVATAVITGHIWPILAAFKGGRGIATGMGTIAALEPITPLVGLAVFIPVVAGTRYVSLGSVLAVLTIMVAFTVNVLVFDGPVPYLWFVLGKGSVVIWMHRDNIKRLAAGTERRIGRPASPAPE